MKQVEGSQTWHLLMDNCAFAPQPSRLTIQSNRDFREVRAARRDLPLPSGHSATLPSENGRAQVKSPEGWPQASLLSLLALGNLDQK